MNGKPLDRRVNAFSPELADERLRGQVEAARFVTGAPAVISAPSVPMRTAANADAPYGSELLHGETLRVFDDANGWIWCQNDADGYVGFVPSETISRDGPPATHRVTALRTFVYPAPDMKLPPVAALSIEARLALGETVETRGTTFRLIGDGERAVVASHVAPLGTDLAHDYVEVAERFLNTPYLWGGRTSLGLDCSALVQLSLMAAGIDAPRDSDMQRERLGLPVPEGDELERGDLVFWPGHVAMLAGPERLIHASGHHMAVVTEPREEAFARIGARTPVTAMRRMSPAK